MNCHALRLAAATLLCLGMFSRPALAQMAGDVNVPPPPLRAEIVPPGPSGSIWVPGYWYWSDGRYKWVGGVWAEARPGYVWVPARWELRNVYYHFVPGHWKALPAPARTVVVTPPPPPPPREEVVVVRPGYVWAPGYWNWDGFQYVWIGGDWRPLRYRPGPWRGPYWHGPHWHDHGPYWRGPAPGVGVGVHFRIH